MTGIQCLKSKKWWGAAAVRAIKTAAQTSAGCIAVTAVWEIDVVAAVGIALTAAVVSLLTSLAGIPEAQEAEESNND